MTASYPNRVCVCGFRRFRERRTPVTSAIERWMLFDSTSFGGFGATPLGTWFGAGTAGRWGLFSGVLRTTRAETVCESCGRVRVSKTLGGIAAFGSYVENNYLYIVGSDAGSIGCLSVRFDSADESYTVPLQEAVIVIPAIIAEEPETVEASPPAGAALVDSAFQAALPTVVSTGTFIATLVDRCGGFETVIASLTLESPPMIFTPLDADLGGAPAAWLKGSVVDLPGSQPGGSGRLSIPFDRCAGVMEYDARFGTLPAEQGWTYQGTGVAADYQLVEGGVLRGQTTAALTSYWRKSLTLTDNPIRAYSYTVLKDGVTRIVGSAPGHGFEAECRYSIAAAGAYYGVRHSFHDRSWYQTMLDGSAESRVFALDRPPGWEEIAGGDHYTNGVEATWINGFDATAASYGTDGIAAAIEMISEWGDRSTPAGTDSFLRNVVFSVGGRFIRPMFTAYSQVTAPRLRLYLIADTSVSVSKTARFRVRYGPGTSSPYAMPASTSDVTVNFTVANTMFETAFDLTGLTANQPFWFTVERVWDHGDDRLDSTVHLIQATLRAS